MAHEYYGVAPEVAMDWRRGGTNVQEIMTREYHTRHRVPKYRGGDDDNRGHGNRHDGRRDGRNDHKHDKHDKHHDR